MLTVVRVLICLFVSSQVYSTLGSSNVALKKPTVQSSTYDNLVSGKAVDGSTNQNRYAGSCSITDNKATNEWLCVDLLQIYDISRIKIYNRLDGPQAFKDRLKGFEVRLSSTGKCDETGFKTATTCYKDDTSTAQSVYTIEKCNQKCVQSQSARFVYVSISREYLQICELQIFPGEQQIFPAPSNVALKKPTVQSSTYDNLVSGKAVDGSTNQNRYAGSCSITDNKATNEWLCVDLLQIYDISRIKIYNRLDGPQAFKDRLKGFEVRLSSTGKCDETGFKTATTCYKDDTSTAQSVYTIEKCNQKCVQSQSARFVYVSISREYLQICELQIFPGEQQIFPAPSNVALKKPTVQSSTYDNLVSGKAVDGSTNQNRYAGSCSITDNKATNEWLCVDLLKIYDISRIKIYNRLDGPQAYKDRLKGFEVRLSSTGKCDETGFKTATTCYKDDTSTAQSVYTIERCNQKCVQSQAARFVYVSISREYLQLCELQIFPGF